MEISKVDNYVYLSIKLFKLYNTGINDLDINIISKQLDDIWNTMNADEKTEAHRQVEEIKRKGLRCNDHS